MAYPEWRFNEGEGFATSAGRNSFLCLYAKLRREGLWDTVATVDWVSDRGEMLFWPAGGEPALQRTLRLRGYSDRYVACYGDDDRTKKKWAWGLRAKGSGAQLHYRGANDPKLSVNVHIDLHTPTPPDTGLWHWIEDDKKRGKTHTPALLQEGLKKQHIEVPSVS